MQEKRSWLKKGRRAVRRPQHVPILHMLPSAVTLVGMFFGLSSVRWAAEGEWEKSCIGIIAAFGTDALDGVLARMLRATSRMGAELDSLVDMVTFGIAPAMLAYHYTQNSQAKPVWALSLFYAMCVSLRLARFNVTQPEKHMLGFYQGLPAAPASLVIITPIVLDQKFAISFFIKPHVYSILIFVTCLLSVSKIPTFALKNRSLHKNVRAMVLMVFCIIIATLSLAPWLIFILFVVGYVSLMPMSARQHRLRVKKFNEENAASAESRISE